MDNKKYMTMGVFTMLVVIGAGVAYYFDPAAINNMIGINAAEIDVVSDADQSMIDGASSTPATIIVETSSDNEVSLPSPTQKTASKKSSVTKAPTGTGRADDLQSGGTMLSSLSSASATIDDASDSIAATQSVSLCSFPLAVPSTTTKKIILNEIAWMGSPTSSTGEWIELKNISAHEVDLSGWELLNTSGKIKISFSGGDRIVPGGIRLLLRGSAPAAASTTLLYSGNLANTGDVLAIIDPQCTVSDYLDASHGWPGGNNTTKQTLERDGDGIGWHTSASPGGTPGAENSAGQVAVAPTVVQTQTQQQSTPAISIAPNIPEVAEASGTEDTSATTSIATSSSPSDVEGGNINSDDNATTTTSTSTAEGAGSTATSSAGHVLIAAVQIAGASSSNDMVKLYNPTASTVDMSGWKLHKKSSTGTDYSLKVFPMGSTIAAGQSFAWANATDGFSETVGANVSSTETLAADNSVALMDAAGDIIDAVAWGTGTDQYGEGPPYPTSPGANQLLSRRSSGGAMVDTENNTNDFTLQ
jgi:hypothetical protein